MNSSNVLTLSGVGEPTHASTNEGTGTTSRPKTARTGKRPYQPTIKLRQPEPA